MCLKGCLLDIEPVLQKTWWSCGYAAASMVLRYHEKAVPKHFPENTPERGLHPLTLGRVYRRASLRIQVGNFNVDDLKYHTKMGRPVTCLVRHKGFGHWVVVLGVERGSVIMNCPDLGRVKEKAVAFLERWWDRGTTVTYKNYGIVTSDGLL